MNHRSFIKFIKYFYKLDVLIKEIKLLARQRTLCCEVSFSKFQKKDREAKKSKKAGNAQNLLNVSGDGPWKKRVIPSLVITVLKKKLTDQLIKELATYRELRRHPDFAQDMEMAIWTTFLHKSSTDT